MEKLCASINTNIASLQTIVTALQNNDHITSYAELADKSGYQITFAKGGAIIIKHGTNGNDGKEGTNGTNGSTPTISVDAEGYWLINGTRIQSNGQDVKAVGQDGTDGTDGSKGADGLTPVIGVDVEGYWTVTIGGTTQRLKDSQGQDVQAVGKDGTNGIDGADGINGDSFFKDIVIRDNKVVITLNDSETNPTVISIPFYQPDDELLIINVETPGTLNSLLTPAQLRSTLRLKLTGTINNSDVRVIDDRMTAIEYVDFSEVVVNELSGFFSYAFCGGEAPTKDYLGNRTIKEVILPPHPLGSGEPFNYCRNLETVTYTANEQGNLWKYTGCNNLQTLIIAESVTDISGQHVCVPFAYVDIASSVQKIHYKSFSSGTEPKTVICRASIPPTPHQDLNAVGSFSYVNKNFLGTCTLMVPTESLSAYSTADGWKQFGNIIAIPN